MTLAESGHAVRACLITNPTSHRSGQDLSEALAVLRENGWEVIVRRKEGGGDATKLARAAADHGCSVVVGCGGDGTLSEIVDGLAGTDVALGVIPGGTVNLWAHELGISLRPRVAAQQLLTAERRRIDLGHIAVNGDQSRHFLLMAGIGVDGAVIGRISKPLKRRLGTPAVWLAAAKALPAFNTARVDIEMDGVLWHGTVAEIVAANTRRYGGFASLTPTAYVDDARLDLCLFTAAGALPSVRQAASLLLHGRPSTESAEEYRAARIAIRSSVKLPVEIDGGRLSLKHVKPSGGAFEYVLTSRPGALTALVPSTYDGGLFRPATTTSLSAPARDVKHADGASDAAGEDRYAFPPAGRRHEKKRRLVVTAVGVDTITGVRTDNGRPLTVIVSPATVAKDADGEVRPVASLLAELASGEEVRVRGVHDRDRGVLIARKLKVRSKDAALH